MLLVAVFGAMAGQGSSSSWWYVSALADEETAVADEETAVAEEETIEDAAPAAPADLTIEDAELRVHT